MCNENRTKYVYPVSAGMNFGTLANLFAEAARECPRTRFVLLVDGILLEVDGQTTQSKLETNYAAYQAQREKDPTFLGDFMAGDWLEMRDLDNLQTDRLRFKPQFG